MGAAWRLGVHGIPALLHEEGLRFHHDHLLSSYGDPTPLGFGLLLAARPRGVSNSGSIPLRDDAQRKEEDDKTTSMGVTPAEVKSMQQDKGQVNASNSTSFAALRYLCASRGTYVPTPTYQKDLVCPEHGGLV